MPVRILASALLSSSSSYFFGNFRTRSFTCPRMRNTPIGPNLNSHCMAGGTIFLRACRSDRATCRTLALHRTCAVGVSIAWGGNVQVGEDLFHKQNICVLPKLGPRNAQSTIGSQRDWMAGPRVPWLSMCCDAMVASTATWTLHDSVGKHDVKVCMPGACR
jgi:hypothetical protein